MEKPCPVTATAEIIGSRWTLQIIHHLRIPRRYCELQDLVGDINPTTFTQRLKFLEEQGLVNRQPDSRSTRQGMYRLTEMGAELLPIVDVLSDWAIRWRLAEYTPFHDRTSSGV
jgi:DNA-binding HxlR family transcriptional regulator